MVLDGLVNASRSAQHAWCGSADHDVISAHFTPVEHGIEGGNLHKETTFLISTCLYQGSTYWSRERDGRVCVPAPGWKLSDGRDKVKLHETTSFKLDVMPPREQEVQGVPTRMWLGANSNLANQSAVP